MPTASAIVEPPSTGMVWPVRYAASSESRKHATRGDVERRRRSAAAGSTASARATRLRGRERAAGHRRVDAAGADAVRAHALRSALRRDEPGERVDAALARGVAGPEAVTADRGGRRDRHDRAAAVGERGAGSGGSPRTCRRGSPRARGRSRRSPTSSMGWRSGPWKMPGRGDHARDRGRASAAVVATAARDRVVVGDVDRERERGPPVGRRSRRPVSRAFASCRSTTATAAPRARRELRGGAADAAAAAGDEHDRGVRSCAAAVVNVTRLSAERPARVQASGGETSTADTAFDGRRSRCTGSRARWSSSPAPGGASGGASRTTSARAARASSSRSGSPRSCSRRATSSTTLGVENLGVVCDIQQRADIDAMVAATVERFGRVDGLVNNAQTFRPMAPIADVERRRRRRLLQLRRQGHAVGDAGGVPAHARPAVGSHRQLRVVDGHHRRARASRRTTRRRRRSARSPAPRRVSGAPTASS